MADYGNRSPMDSEPSMSEAIAIGAFVWLCLTLHHKDQVIDTMTSVIQSCSDVVIKSNENLDQENIAINTAAQDAWSDYDTMGVTLEDLPFQEENPMGNPCVVPAQ